MKWATILILIIGLWASAPAQTLEDYTGLTAAQLSAMTDRVTVPNTAYWNTHAYLQLKLLIDRVLRMYSADSTTAYITWDKLSAAVQDSILSNLAANSVVWSDLVAAVQDSIQLQDRLSDNAVTYAKLDTSAVGFIDVRKFGALGDGTTDDTDAIQTAIDYVNSIGGGTVFFPNGTYLVTKKKTYSCLVTYAGVKLFGTGTRNSALYDIGGGTTILLSANQNTCILVNEDYQKHMNGESTDYWHFGSIENMTLYANGDNNATTASCIKIYNAGETSVIRNVNCTTFRDTAFVVDGCTPALIENVCCFPATNAGVNERIAMKISGRTTRIIAPSGDECNPYFWIHGDGSVSIFNPKLEFSDTYGNPAIYIEGSVTGTYAEMAQTVSITGGNIWKVPVLGRSGDMVKIFSDSTWAGRIQLRGVEFSGFKNLIKQITHGVTDSLYRANDRDYFIDDIVWGDGYKVTSGDLTTQNGMATRKNIEFSEGGLYADNFYTPYLRIGQKQNYLLRSQDFNNWYKEGSGSLTVNSDVIIAPDGTKTADEFSNTSGSALGALQNISDGPPVSQGSKTTLSIWLKGVGTAIGDTVQLVLAEIGSGAEPGVVDYATLTSSWKLHVLKYQNIKTKSMAMQVKIIIPANTDSVYAWGAQLNSGWKLYPYTVTTTDSIITGTQAIGGNVEFANVKTADSLSVGTGGVWMRNMYQSGNDLGIIFYNAALSRIDTVFAKQP